jgi:membrane protein implicated in regulation of membrane protease activity
MFVTLSVFFLILLLPLPSWLKYAGPLTMGFVLFVLAFSLRFGLGNVVADPITVVNDLAHKLRVARYRVEVTNGELIAQVDSMSAIRIRARASGSGAELTYRMDGTPAGWTVTLILVFSGYFIILIPPVVLFMLRRVRRFAQEQVVPSLVTSEVPGADSASLRIHKALVDSLSEGYRLSSEAYEAEKSNYEDNVIILVVLGFLVLVGSSLAFLAINIGAFSENFSISFPMSVAIASSFTFLSVWLLRRRVKPRLNELKGWATKLEGALVQEISSAKPKDEEPGVFELLADAWKHVPKWLEVRRKSGLYREPGTWLLILCFAGLSFTGLVIASFLMLAQSPLTSVIVGVLSAGLLYVVHVLYSGSRKRLDEERARVSSDWNRRLGMMNSQMEKHMREL